LEPLAAPDILIECPQLSVVPRISTGHVHEQLKDAAILVGHLSKSVDASGKSTIVLKKDIWSPPQLKTGYLWKDRRSFQQFRSYFQDLPNELGRT